MDESPQDPTRSRPAGAQQDRLDSWKKIAGYLKRDVTTVQRWERREGMPVHRHLHDKLGSVYAFRSELDGWWQSRRAQLISEEGDTAEANAAAGASDPEVSQPEAPVPQTASPIRPGRRLLRWLGVAAAIVAVTSTVVWFERSDYFLRNPLANAQFRPLTDFEGAESSAAISRDGSSVAFLADRDGQMDVWVTQVGSGDFRNLTQGSVHDMVNPLIRTLGFSPDGTLISIWVRQPDGSRPEDVSLMAVPTRGGPLRRYLAEAAEFDWSSDGKRLVYHTTAPGDPLYVREQEGAKPHRIFVAPTGVHCHFPVWSPNDEFIYFAQGIPPVEWDIWRIRPTGGIPERITFHNARVTHPIFLDGRTLLYLATAPDGSGPWLYVTDVERRVSSRISFGVEAYTSLAASANAEQIVATVANPRATLWRVPIGAQPVTESAATRVALPTGGGRSPRVGRDYLLYVSSKGGREGVWKLAHGGATELWHGTHGQIVGAPAIAPVGRRVAFSIEEHGRTRLYVMNEDGTDVRPLGASLQLRGTPAWASDGESLVFAADHDGIPRLYRIPLNDSPPVLLVSEYSIDPAPSPDGHFLIYSGPDVGTTFPLRAAADDGRSYHLPSLMLTRGARRVGFVRGSRELVVLRGEIEHKDFWLIDLETGSQRQLTNLGRDYIIRDFDVSADGSEIVFDRAQDKSNIVLIDRTRS